MPIHTGPCEPWPLDMSCCDLPDDTEQATIDRWAMVATKVLWALTGRRLGPSCPYVARPCKKSCMDGYFGRLNFVYPGSGGLYPYILDGQWYNASPCGCSTDCSCGELCEIRLESPIFDVVSVQDGETLLPPSAYRVDNGNTLVRTDGNCWDTCQALDEAPGEPNTLTVTYRTGLPLDELAIAAVSRLACHYIRGCGNGCGCSLGSNRNVSRVSRQGVDLEFADAASLYTDGRTGIPLVDQFIAVTNPYSLTGASRVLSPDVKLPRITTFP